MYRKRKQLSIAMCVYLGQMIVGYALGWSSSVLPKFDNEEQSPLSRPISATEASLIGSLLYFGGVIVPLITTNLANYWGRKLCLALGGVMSLFAYLVLGLAVNLSMVYAGRILAGVGCITVAILNMVYMGEIASKEIRGILLSGIGVSASLGALLSYSTGPFVTYSGTAYIAIGLCVCYLLGLLTIPESPTFYVIKNNKKKVIEILETLGRTNDVDGVLASKVIEEKHEWSQLFSIKTNRRALLITTFLQILQQTSGVVAIVFFTTNIFKMANSSVEPSIATIIVGFTQVIGSFIAPFVVEKSRKKLMLVSTACCCLCLAVFGTYFYLDAMGYAIVQNFQWLPLATLIIYFLVYNMGFGIIPTMLAGEMFQSNVRSLGSTFAFSCGLICGFGTMTAFGYIITYLGGYVAFWIFSGICLLAFLFTIFFVPETKGKSLLEIQLILAGPD